MNKRLFAVIAGTILVQSAAFAADNASDSKCSDKSAASCEKAKNKAAKKVSIKTDKSASKKIAANTDQTIGAY